MKKPNYKNFHPSIRESDRKRTEQWQNEYFYDGETIRWISTNRVPPKDCLEKMVYFGYLDESIADKSLVIGQAETRALFMDCRNRTPKRIKATQEQMFHALEGTLINPVTNMILKPNAKFWIKN